MVSGRPTARPWLPYTAAIVAGFAVIAAAYLIVRPAADVGCTPLDVVSSTEKDALRRRAGRALQQQRGGSATGAPSHRHRPHLRASRWRRWPATGRRKHPACHGRRCGCRRRRLWTGQLQLLDQAAGRPAQTPGQYPSIANSPLVIAMPAAEGRGAAAAGPAGLG